MDKIIKFINDNSEETVVKYILKNNKNKISDALQNVLKSKEQMDKKIENIMIRINHECNENFKGKILFAKRDCMKNFVKDQMVVITEINEQGIVIDGVALVSPEIIDKYFRSEGDIK